LLEKDYAEMRFSQNKIYLKRDSKESISHQNRRKGEMLQVTCSSLLIPQLYLFCTDRDGIYAESRRQLNENSK
jgi:hypothetical protein